VVAMPPFLPCLQRTSHSALAISTVNEWYSDKVNQAFS
jgi:hypothetical protein